MSDAAQLYHRQCGGATARCLAVLAILLTAPHASAAACSGASPDCTIQDLTAPASGTDILASLSSATRRLTLRNLSLRDWPSEPRGRSGQLEGLELDRVASGDASSLLGGSLPGLRTLRVRGGSGSSGCPFSGGLAAFPVLEEVAISGCRLAALTAAWLRQLPRLQRLEVDSAKVDSVHLAGVDWETRAALRDLRLTNNSLNTLADDAFGLMPNLTSLILDGNIIQYIQPAAFAQLPRLTELSIVLPREGQLAKIWEASLDGRFDNNTKLEILRLANARLAEEQIPRSFEQLKSLRELNLSGHRFRSLHHSVLAALTSLQRLDLSNGSLVCLYDRNFGVMSRLHHLNLAHNAISVIGRRALLGLTSLTSLNLAGNPIESIEPSAFCSHRPEIKNASLLIAWGLDPGRVKGAANITDPCPADFNPDRLILSSKPQCPLAKSPGSDSTDEKLSKKPSEQSRHTFLIIIGLCVAFLLITVISMMAYKGWSKRKNAQLAKDEEKELELQAMVVAAAAEEGGDVAASGGGGGKKPAPPNGRQHRHHHHRQAGSEKAKPPPTESLAAAAEATQPAVPGATVPPPENTVETTAQVESPERRGQTQHPPSSPGEAPPAASAKPQMRPGITLMTTVPEDSDLEARAITTLVVV